MARESREPQSYGSGDDWVSGKTDQRVNDPKSVPSGSQRDFYESHRESDQDDDPGQGGRTSPQQLMDQHETGPSSTRDAEPVTKVTSSEGGAKRDSYFKRRDYD